MESENKSENFWDTSKIDLFWLDLGIAVESILANKIKSFLTALELFSVLPCCCNACYRQRSSTGDFRTDERWLVSII